MSLIVEMLRQMTASTQSKDVRAWLLDELLQNPTNRNNTSQRARRNSRSGHGTHRGRGKVSVEMLEVLTKELDPAEFLSEEGAGIMTALHTTLIKEGLIDEASNYISWLGRLVAKYARDGRKFTALHLLRTRAIYIGTLATLQGYSVREALAYSFVTGLSQDFPPDRSISDRLSGRLMGDLSATTLMEALQLDEQEMAELTSQFLSEVLI